MNHYTFNELIAADYYRFSGKKGWWSLIGSAFRNQDFRYILYFRWFQSWKLHLLARVFLKRLSSKMCMAIGWKTTIGKGLQIVHGGCIAINNEAVIGTNCTLYHGVTIGMEFRGKRCENPVIGNNVWIGANATIVGNVTVGDDVLIASGAFVNFDVPSHSVVLGNPGQVISRENATEGYILNRIEQ